MWRALLAAFVVLATLVAGGCGGDERGAVASVVRAGLTSEDARTVCEGSLAPALLTQIYGGTAKCHAVEGQDAERVGQAQSVDVSRVSIRGERATAVVKIHGGSRDGAGGGLTLARRPGGWRVTDLSVALLRSQFEVGIRKLQTLDPVAKTCVIHTMRKVHDAEFERLAFHPDTIGQRRLAAVARRCDQLVAASGRIAI
ncbi:MAG TPA: hypothetical protein VMY78_07715 [Solirubrobacteraceae bacterium]|nr:hypothetical protein [Solirubrobacteraceae bacterium]